MNHKTGDSSFLSTTAYLAAEGFETQLEAELQGIVQRHGRLFITQGRPQPAYWSQNIWYDARRLSIRSITDAANQLRSLQRNWWPYAHSLHRRTEHIQARLPFVSAKPMTFPASMPQAPLGAWTLLDESTMLAAPRCASPFPNGEVRFAEFKEGPPSRAYLKLFEALTRLGIRPQAGERCLELGASPGGWTWVLANLGAQVIAYDRSPLAPGIAALPGVSIQQGDAFAAKPDRIGRIDWLLSDVICYPQRLLEYVKVWIASGLCRNFICTIKFQGDSHYDAIAAFAAIPGSTVFHLFHNKHELTWALVAPRDQDH